MYTDVITLFNRYPSRTQGDTWIPIVLRNVDVNMDRAKIVKTLGENSSDTVSLHVKYTFGGQGIEISGKHYVLPKEYSRISPELLEEYITFKSGKDFDFFYVGEWADTERISDDAYKNGFYNYMNSEYDNVFAISTVSGAYSLIKHFEITGK